MTRFAIFVALFLYLAPTGAAEPKKMIRHRGGVPNVYIIVLSDKPAPPAVPGIVRSLAAKYRLTIRGVWTHAPQGFLALGDESDFVALSQDPRVKYVEQDAAVPLPASRLSARYFFPYDPLNRWFLDRLDETTPAGMDSVYTMCPEATTVTAYVIDSGIYASHDEFVRPSGVSAVERQINFVRHELPSGLDFAPDTTNGCPNNDEMAHGTSVAALLAGNRLGASHAKLVSLRILGCAAKSGFTSDLLGALNWLGQRQGAEAVGVVNLSSFVPPYDEDFSAVGEAVSNVVQRTNMPFFTSADNYSTDGCTLFSPNYKGYNPATRQDGAALVVGGTMLTGNYDARWQETEFIQAVEVAKIGPSSGSNGGDCVGVYAPAQNITVAMNRVTNDPQKKYMTSSGTSYSAPLVAGIAARYIEWYVAENGSRPTASDVYYQMTSGYGAPVGEYKPMPTYWMCFRDAGNGLFYEQPYRTQQGCLTADDKGPYSFHPPSNNAYKAQMVYWNPFNGPSPYCDDEFTTEHW